MSRVEEQGFQAIVGYGAKLTVVEGVAIAVGAAVALGAAVLTSRSRSEVVENPTVEQIEAMRREIEDDGEMMTLLNFGPERWSSPERRKQLLSSGLWLRKGEAIASFRLKTGVSRDDLLKLLQGGMGPTIAMRAESGGFHPVDPKELKAIASLARHSTETIRKIARMTHTMYSNTMYSTRELLEKFNRLEGWDEESLQAITGIALHLKGNFELAERFHRMGFTPKEVDDSGVGFMGFDLSKASDDDLEDLRSLLRKFSGDSYSYIRPYVGKRDNVRALLKLNVKELPGWEYGIRPEAEESSGEIDWEGYEALVRKWEKMPRALLNKIRVQGNMQVGLWDKALKDDDLKAKIFAMDAAYEVLGDVLAPSPLYHLAQDLTYGDEEKRVEALAKALKSGKLAKLRQTLENSDYTTTECEDLMSAFFTYYDKIVDWKSAGDLNEQIDVIMGQLQKEAKKKAAFDPAARKARMVERRARDRLAQRDPEWAISEFPLEYKRGKRVAKLLEQITDYVEGLVRKGETVVVHGRDGELLYDMLMRRPGIDRSKVRYALTSRPMTTFASVIPRTYKDYLGRVVPKGAVHIDTGFAGSIPRWFDQKGYEVKAIRMVSATAKEEEIPVSIPLTDEERRDIVLSDLEHSSQRLENPTPYVEPNEDEKEGYGGFESLEYSWAAPGYHARKYGVFDELGIPRLRAATPKTRFEEKKQTQYRISSEPEASIEDLEDEDLAKAKS